MCGNDLLTHTSSGYRKQQEDRPGTFVNSKGHLVELVLLLAKSQSGKPVKLMGRHEINGALPVHAIVESIKIDPSTGNQHTEREF